MNPNPSDFLTTMRERGFIKDTSFEDAAFCAHHADQPITAYIGFDLTAPSLHVGSLIQLMVLRHLKRMGHNPIALLGEATTKIGDPSGKDETRKMLSMEQIAANHDGIAQVIRNVVPGIDFATNDDWFSEYSPSFMGFLGKYGHHFTVNRMMTFESVKSRLERTQPLTFLEFCYMLLQAVDFRELNLRTGCDVQIGGSDQWGNIVNGIEITRRMDGKEVFGITTHLLLDSTGNKMGKSAGKPVWLDAEMTPVFDFFQYWRNIDDSDITRFFYLFTEMTDQEIGFALTTGLNDAKKKLAFEVTKIVHGEAAAEEARARAIATFETFDASALPVEGSFVPGTTIIEVVQSLMGGSKGEARRLIQQGGVAIDGEKTTFETECLMAGERIIKIGKKRTAKVEVKP